MNISVFLQPGAKQEKIEKQIDLMGNEIYKIWIKEKPIDGQANQSLIDFLAQYFKLPKSRVCIIKGHTSRYKVVALT